MKTGLVSLTWIVPGMEPSRQTVLPLRIELEYGRWLLYALDSDGTPIVTAIPMDYVKGWKSVNE